MKSIYFGGSQSCTPSPERPSLSCRTLAKPLVFLHLQSGGNNNTHVQGGGVGLSMKGDDRFKVHKSVSGKKKQKTSVIFLLLLLLGHKLFKLL